MEQTLSRRIHGISSLIGNTPLLAIEFEYKGTRRTIYAKAEYLNMTGSIKDRMTYPIIEKAYESGALREGSFVYTFVSRYI